MVQLAKHSPTIPSFARGFPANALRIGRLLCDGIALAIPQFDTALFAVCLDLKQGIGPMTHRRRKAINHHGLGAALLNALAFAFVLAAATIACTANVSANEPAVSGDAESSEIKSRNAEPSAEDLGTSPSTGGELSTEGTETSRGQEAAESPVADVELPDIAEAIQLDEMLGEFVEEQFDVLKTPALSTSLLGRLTAVSILLVLGMIILKLNSVIATRLDRGLSDARRNLGLDADRFSTIFSWQRWTGYTLGFVSLLLMAALLLAESGQETPTAVLWLEATVSNGGAIAAILLVVLIMWEGVNAVMEHVISKDSFRQSSRVQTLLPVVRNIVFFFLMLLTVLTVLSEVGIEIMPVLAGAGVVGIAIGFGAQTLVKDFLTGFTIIVEDLLQIGDVVTIAGRTGAVKRITLRKIELRSLEGTVHTVPFSSIDIVDNLTKDYTFYLMDIGVAYKEDTDQVVTVLKQVDEELRDDPKWRYKVLSPLEVLGVDQFADSAVVIKARIKTQAQEKWNVGREFNRRMKIAFDREGIEIPFPHRTLMVPEALEVAAQRAGDSAPSPEAGESSTQDDQRDAA